MKDNTNIFVIDEEGLLDFNKHEARLTPEYKAIIIRDKGSPGDHEGRKKAFAFKELLYVYCYVHPASIFRDLPNSEKHTKSKIHAQLPNDWEADEIVKAACVRFEEDLKLSALYYSYINANKGVYGVGQDIAFFNTRREQLRQNIEFNTNKLKSTNLEDEIAILHKDIQRDTNDLLDLGNKIINISNNLPTAFKTIEDLKKKLAEETGNKKEIYGGGTLGNREQ